MSEAVKSPVITIVGAGIGGLTLAAALIRSGMQVQVVEQSAGFSRIGTGIGVAPNATKVLRGLGLEAKLEEQAFQPAYRASREWNTANELGKVPFAGAMEEKYGSPYFLLHRGDLHQALYDLVPPGVVRFGMRLQTIEQNDDQITMHFANGETLVADAVVGADGVHSPIRESLFGADDAHYTGKVAYRSVYPIELLKAPLMDPMAKWWSPDRHIVVYYVSAGKEVYFTTSVPHDESIVESFSAKGDLDELLAAFEGFHPAVLDMLAVCPEVHKWAIFERDPLPTWQAGRVVLIGDACHPMTPFMQQGSATAMEDAVVLARCIDEVGREDVREAFALYEQIRKPRADIIQQESSQNRWNKTRAGSDQVSESWVWTYDAWSVPLEIDPVLQSSSG